jgi:hypothetical protein
VVPLYFIPLGMHSFFCNGKFRPDLHSIRFNQGTLRRVGSFPLLPLTCRQLSEREGTLNTPLHGLCLIDYLLFYPDRQNLSRGWGKFFLDSYSMVITVFAGVPSVNSMEIVSPTSYPIICGKSTTGISKIPSLPVSVR